MPFWEQVDIKGPDECWPWKGVLDHSGYGRVRRFGGEKEMAHRVAWEKRNGPVPEGKVLDHLCRNRACCNPGHLEAVTSRENTVRGVSPVAMNARKTHCKNGHKLSGANVRINSRGRRECLVCLGLASWHCYDADAGPTTKETPHGGSQ